MSLNFAVLLWELQFLCGTMLPPDLDSGVKNSFNIASIVSGTSGDIDMASNLILTHYPSMKAYHYYEINIISYSDSMGKVNIGYVGFNHEQCGSSSIKDVSPDESFYLQSDGKISINQSEIEVNSLCDNLNITQGDAIGIGIELEDEANAFVTYNGEVIFAIKNYYKMKHYYPAIRHDCKDFKYQLNTGTSAFKYTNERKLRQIDDRNKYTEKDDRDMEFLEIKDGDTTTTTTIITNSDNADTTIIATTTHTENYDNGKNHTHISDTTAAIKRALKYGSELEIFEAVEYIRRVCDKDKQKEEDGNDISNTSENEILDLLSNGLLASLLTTIKKYPNYSEERFQICNAIAMLVSYEKDFPRLSNVLIEVLQCFHFSLLYNKFGSSTSSGSSSQLSFLRPTGTNPIHTEYISEVDAQNALNAPEESGINVSRGEHEYVGATKKISKLISLEMQNYGSELMSRAVLHISHQLFLAFKNRNIKELTKRETASLIFIIEVILTLLNSLCPATDTSKNKYIMATLPQPRVHLPCSKALYYISLLPHCREKMATKSTIMLLADWLKACITEWPQQSSADTTGISFELLEDERLENYTLNTTLNKEPDVLEVAYYSCKTIINLVEDPTNENSNRHDNKKTSKRDYNSQRFLTKLMDAQMIAAEIPSLLAELIHKSCKDAFEICQLTKRTTASVTKFSLPLQSGINIMAVLSAVSRKRSRRFILVQTDVPRALCCLLIDSVGRLKQSKMDQTKMLTIGEEVQNYIHEILKLILLYFSDITSSIGAISYSRAVLLESDDCMLSVICFPNVLQSLLFLCKWRNTKTVQLAALDVILNILQNKHALIGERLDGVADTLIKMVTAKYNISLSFVTDGQNTNPTIPSDLTVADETVRAVITSGEETAVRAEGNERTAPLLTEEDCDDAIKIACESLANICLSKNNNIVELFLKKGLLKVMIKVQQASPPPTDEIRYQALCCISAMCSVVANCSFRGIVTSLLTSLIAESSTENLLSSSSSLIVTRSHLVTLSSERVHKEIGVLANIRNRTRVFHESLEVFSKALKEDNVAIKGEALKGLSYLAVDHELSVSIVKGPLKDIIQVIMNPESSVDVIASAEKVLLNLDFKNGKKDVEMAQNSYEVMVEWFTLRRAGRLQEFAIKILTHFWNENYFPPQVSEQLIVKDYAITFDQYLAYSVLNDNYDGTDSPTELVRKSFPQHLHDSVIDSVISGLHLLSTQQFSSEALNHIDELMETILTKIKDSIKKYKTTKAVSGASDNTITIKNVRDTLFEDLEKASLYYGAKVNQSYNDRIIYSRRSTSVTSSINEALTSPTASRSRSSFTGSPLNFISKFFSGSKHSQELEDNLQEDNPQLFEDSDSQPKEEIENWLQLYYPSVLQRNRIAERLAGCDTDVTEHNLVLPDRVILLQPQKYISFKVTGSAISRMIEESHPQFEKWALTFRDSTFVQDFFNDLKDCLLDRPEICSFNFVCQRPSMLEPGRESSQLGQFLLNLPSSVKMASFVSALTADDIANLCEHQVSDNSTTPLQSLAIIGHKLEKHDATLVGSSLVKLLDPLNEYNDYKKEDSEKKGYPRRPSSSTATVGTTTTTAVIPTTEKSNLVKSSLLYLDVTDNNLDGGSCDVIFGAACNGTLQGLELSKNKINDTFIEVFQQKCYLKNCKLRYLGLSSTGITNKIACELLKCLLENNALISVDLSCNEIKSSAEFNRCIETVIFNNKTLRKLDISRNYLTNEEIEESNTKTRTLTSIRNGLTEKKNGLSPSVSLHFIELEGNRFESSEIVLYEEINQIVKNNRMAWMATSKSIVPTVLEPNPTVAAKGQNRLCVLFSFPLVMESANREIVPFPMLDISTEREVITQAFSDIRRNITVHFNFATTANLSESLAAGFRALHYSGHGEKGNLFMENDRGLLHIVTASDIKNICKVAGQLWDFLFISCCNSYEVGQAFVESGVPHVICVKDKVLELVSNVFTRALYLALAEGKTVQEAFTSGKVAVRSHYDVNRITNCELEVEKFRLLPENVSHNKSIFDAKKVTIWPPQDSEYSENFPLQIPKMHLLPNPLIKFVGRKKETFFTVNEVKIRRAVQLRGKANVGKSSIAAAAGRYMLERRMFKDGVIFLELKGISTYQEFIHVFKATLYRVSSKARKEMVAIMFSENPSPSRKSQEIFSRSRSGLHRFCGHFPSGSTSKKTNGKAVHPLTRFSSDENKIKFEEADTITKKEVLIFAGLSSANMLIIIDHANALTSSKSKESTAFLSFLDRLLNDCSGVKLLLTTTDNQYIQNGGITYEESAINLPPLVGGLP